MDRVGEIAGDGDVESGHVFVEGVDGVGFNDADALAEFLKGKFAEGVAEERDGAGGGPEIAGDEAEEGGFAAAIGADNGGDGGGGDGPVDGLEDGAVEAGEGEVGEGEDVLHLSFPITLPTFRIVAGNAGTKIVAAFTGLPPLHKGLRVEFHEFSRERPRLVCTSASAPIR